MLLYHYAVDRFDILKSKRAQGILTHAEVKESEAQVEKYYKVAPYIDSISFFFDPVPLLLLPKMYPKDHSVWVKGKKLFQYVVDATTLEKFIHYNVVETPTDVKMVDTIVDEEWDNPDEKYKIEYFKDRKTRKLLSGEQGKSLTGLMRQIKTFKGLTETFYVAAGKRKDFKELSSYYAANVPHVMLYPSKGVIQFQEVTEVVVGK